MKKYEGWVWGIPVIPIHGELCCGAHLNKTVERGGKRGLRLIDLNGLDWTNKLPLRVRCTFQRTETPRVFDSFGFTLEQSGVL